MSKISQVCGKSQIFKIEEIDIEFKSSFLTIDDLPVLMALSEDLKNASIEDKEKKGRAIADLIFKVLKMAIPDASDEELKEFGLRNMKQLIETIIEISGLKNEGP